MIINKENQLLIIASLMPNRRNWNFGLDQDLIVE